MKNPLALLALAAVLAIGLLATMAPHFHYESPEAHAQAVSEAFAK